MGKPLRSATSQSLTLNLSFETVRGLRRLAEAERTRVSLLTEKLLAEAMTRRDERQRIVVLLAGDNVAK